MDGCTSSLSRLLPVLLLTTDSSGAAFDGLTFIASRADEVVPGEVKKSIPHLRDELVDLEQELDEYKKFALLSVVLPESFLT